MKVIPELGSTVEVSFIGEVVAISKHGDQYRVSVRMPVADNETEDVKNVPVVCVSEFDPNKEAAWNDEVMAMGRHE